MSTGSRALTVDTADVGRVRRGEGARARVARERLNVDDVRPNGDGRGRDLLRVLARRPIAASCSTRERQP